MERTGTRGGHRRDMVETVAWVAVAVYSLCQAILLWIKLGEPSAAPASAPNECAREGVPR